MTANGTHPIGVMVNMETQVIVHGGDCNSISQIFRQVAFVGHVIMQSVVQFNVDIADQCTSH